MSNIDGGPLDQVQNSTIMRQKSKSWTVSSTQRSLLISPMGLIRLAAGNRDWLRMIQYVTVSRSIGRVASACAASRALRVKHSTSNPSGYVRGWQLET